MRPFCREGGGQYTSTRVTGWLIAIKSDCASLKCLEFRLRGACDIHLGLDNKADPSTSNHLGCRSVHANLFVPVGA